ncbi:ribonucleotide reductase, partial [bacterium]|nr:ribonucleotide reductase [bacterium]
GEIEKHGIRNLTLLSQAPTGTTSLLAEASSGIEPIFAKEYVRKDATGEHLMVHPLFVDDHGDHLVTAHDITYQEHIAVQARVQKYIDSAVSKTINMPACATPSQIGDAYMLAWKSGCKGITVYRDGSLESVCEVCELN